ncbi:cytochrome P450 2C15 [Hyalella azteca]|uniref:Cytochrome P450 2C15 n=1 Tax=Hyalella azteca TaxID=294128 RepID=A0A8B7PGC5_HYAAZ|nr:cytochrome P450 2C15 [Hyalella azteca]
MFQAGSDTINNVLKWVVHLLARYPDVAKRMQDQIDSVVPRDAMVSLNDKPSYFAVAVLSLPLVEAFVMETLRYSSLLPINVQRAATRDTTIGGYFIPKGGNFIPKVGTLSPRWVLHPQGGYFIPNVGTSSPRWVFHPQGGYFIPKAGTSSPRQCAGEVLARMELFLFTAAIAQNFDVMPAPTADLRRVKVATLGGLRAPEDHELIYRPRIYTQKN